MITQPTMLYHANRTFALAELLDMTYEQAYQAANEGTDDPDTVIERLKGLLFCAHEVASSLAADLDGLIAKAAPETPEAPKPTPLAASSQGAYPCDRINTIGLSYFTCDVLHRNEIIIISQLTSLTVSDLIRLPKVGKKTIEDIKARLAANGLSLSAGGAA